MTVAPEGRPFIAAGVVTLAVLVVLFLVRGGWWILPVAALAPVALWIPWFFRDPAPAGPRGSCLVLAPANGKVVSVSELEEPAFLEQVATRENQGIQHHSQSFTHRRHGRDHPSRAAVGGPS